MDKIELFFDRFGWLIAFFLFIGLIVSTALWMARDSDLTTRIEKLEGCCEEVHEYMQANSGPDEEMIGQIIDEKMSQIASDQSAETKKLIEERTQSIKEEVRSQISEELKESVSESVKAEVESLQISQQESAKKTSSKKSQTKASNTQSQQTTTQITTQTTNSASYQQQKNYDPDDQHFKVGSADEEED